MPPILAATEAMDVSEVMVTYCVVGGGDVGGIGGGDGGDGVGGRCVVGCCSGDGGAGTGDGAGGG